MRNVTIKQLSSQLNMNYVEAAGLMKVLVATGQANKVAKVFHRTGMGKPSTIYSLPNKIYIRIPKIKPEPKYVMKNGRFIKTSNDRTKYISKKKNKIKKAA